MTTTLRPQAGHSDLGLLLVGHGSRAAEGVDEFLATARLVAERLSSWAVEPCFLEFAQPTIVEGFAALARRGVRRVVVAPVMLFAAAHIRRDIPVAVSAAIEEYSQVSVQQAEHLGCHNAIVALSRLRFDEALAGKPSLPGDATVLVLVGRGSRDAEATAEMLDFSRHRAARAPMARVETGFLAMAEPPLEDALERIASAGACRIVVQPHLLFGGILLDRIGTIVERMAHKYPRTEWLLTAHLGPDELVVHAIESRAAAALEKWGTHAVGDACTA